MKSYFVIFSLLVAFIFSISEDDLKLNLDPENKFFTIPIEVGSGQGQQQFEVQVDTTTSETWVPSSQTTIQFPKLDISKSKTGEKTNKTFEVEDEDGYVRGKSSFDQIKVGQYHLNRMGFVLVNEYENNFKDYPQGKLGLGFRREHGIEFDWIGSLKKAGQINKEVFLIVPDKKALIVGEIPLEYSNQEYSYCNLTETYDLDDEYRSGWVCELTHIFFGIDTKKKDLDVALEFESRVIFDSAYEYISVPKRHLKKFKDEYFLPFFNESCTEVRNKEETYFVCSDEQKIKEASMAFLLGGYAYVVPWDKLFIKNNDGLYESQIRFFKENDDIFGFGAPFVNLFTVVYDQENKQVGFYGGEKIDMKKEWDEYVNGLSPWQKREKIKKMIIAGAIGGVLLIIIIVIIIKSLKDKKNPRIGH